MKLRIEQLMQRTLALAGARLMTISPHPAEHSKGRFG
jgi:hypothetical protein